MLKPFDTQLDLNFLLRRKREKVRTKDIIEFSRDSTPVVNRVIDSIKFHNLWCNNIFFWNKLFGPRSGVFRGEFFFHVWSFESGVQIFSAKGKGTTIEVPRSWSYSSCQVLLEELTKLLSSVRPFVTFTGVDEFTDLDKLTKMPNAEFGLLFSLSERNRRYPKLHQIYEIAHFLNNHSIPVALHVCGPEARRAVSAGALNLIPFNRVQINGSITVEGITRLCNRHVYQEFVTQFRGPYSSHLLDTKLSNHSILFDFSGGRGKLPEKWYQPRTSQRMGFAGGLNPQNLKSQLPLIRKEASRGWWIDMESGVRNEEDKFDVDKALSCYCELEAFIRKSTNLYK